VTALDVIDAMASLTDRPRHVAIRSALTEQTVM